MKRCFSSRCTGNCVSDAYPYAHSFLRFFSHIGHYSLLSRVSCVTQWVLNYYFIYSHMYMSAPTHSPSPPVAISLFSTSEIPFLSCR